MIYDYLNVLAYSGIVLCFGGLAVAVFRFSRTETIVDKLGTRFLALSVIGAGIATCSVLIGVSI